MLNGKHLISGAWIDGPTTFVSRPVSGEGHTFAGADSGIVDQAALAAEEAFTSFSATTRAQRSAFLRAIADEIDARGDAITEIGTAETGLPEARLVGERGRTVGQLRLFADHIEDGSYLDRRHDVALPDREPLPRPDLRLVQRPLGPVAIFGASNFPLAFSVAGGDTASALAAGCPVVVKGHAAHPGTGDIVAQAIEAARQSCGLHPGVFSFIQDAGHAAGTALVTHPLISAVGFTGSLKGGRALFDLCTQREVPIPFFGELGSINPIFALPGALSSRGKDIAAGWAQSLTMGAGQFCTNPGVVILPDGPDADGFIETAMASLRDIGVQTMLTPEIAEGFDRAASKLSGAEGVSVALRGEGAARGAAPVVMVVHGETWLANADLHEEVFGPLGFIVRARDEDQLITIAKALEGQLTATLQMDSADGNLAATLLPILERKAGRVLANGFPTGVEVSDAMVHGGPYPASTNFGATSVGTMAIRRFLRPVCYQNLPEDLLPVDAR